MVYTQTCIAALLSMALGQELRVETSCIEVFHQEKLVRIIANWIIVAFAKDFNDTWIVSRILIRYHSRAEYVLNLSISFTIEVKINCRFIPVNVVFRAKILGHSDLTNCPFRCELYISKVIQASKWLKNCHLQTRKDGKHQKHTSKTTIYSDQVLRAYPVVRERTSVLLIIFFAFLGLLGRQITD